jgi:predicted transcriptional regulator
MLTLRSPLTDANTLELTANVVLTFVANNPVRRVELPLLIETVHSALARLELEEKRSLFATRERAVCIQRSITPDYLICLEDGKRFKSLRRHLAKLGLTPEQYRVKWNLPRDYPMAAPNYSAARSASAKKHQLGRSVNSARRRGRLARLADRGWSTPSTEHRGEY